MFLYQLVASDGTTFEFACYPAEIGVVCDRMQEYYGFPDDYIVIRLFEI